MNKLVTFLASEKNHWRILKWTSIVMAIDLLFMVVALLWAFTER
ncbi:hypothetical protein LMG28727_01161 [Paraburkholderia kirstenboschensis]|jgi:hypothetical protein|nr:hypothetical protein [Paraburkholderia kirstenboschensis]CAD6515568.1 hypothetical protein LMG28727_01161 [Paraburkholderia kirstenboschensis]